MPSITAYSPYEALSFFQLYIQHGTNSAALREVSAELKQNEHIRDQANLDAERFSTSSLQQLYNEYMSNEAANGLPVNGDAASGERSPKRRKLSNSTQPQDNIAEEAGRLVYDIVDRLYLKYKEDVISEIKKDEEDIAQLHNEIVALEQQIETDTRRNAQNHISIQSTVQPGANQSEVSTTDETKSTELDSSRSRSTTTTQDLVATVPAQATSVVPKVQQTSPSIQRAKSPLPPDSSSSRPLSTGSQPRNSQQPPSGPSQYPSPGAFARHLPSPSSQRPSYGTGQPQSMYPVGQTSSGHPVPQVAAAQQRPLVRGQQAGGVNRGSPVPYQGQPPYPPYPQYPPPQWHPHMSPQQYQQHAPYATPQYYPQPPNGRHPQTPQQLPYVQYPHTAPMQYLPQQQQWRGQQWPLHPASAITTPTSRLDGRVSLPGSASSTPWKRKQSTNHLRPKSPSRPDREVSPLTDREDSPPQINTPQDASDDGFKRNATNNRTQPKSRPRNRGPVVTSPVAHAGRSQSATSRTSDAQQERSNASRLGQRIKAEAPSTPLPTPLSDGDQPSSGRRGRPRSSTITSQADGLRTTTTKRKRDSPSPKSPARSSPIDLATPSMRRTNPSHHPSLVIVSKNFAKTSQLLLNEITSHKLAGIFAKPLSERDAPGYKDLVLRPQDLKSIKAAISKGNRAALAAIEAIEGDSEATPTRQQPISISTPQVGPIGNGFFFVTKTNEIVPPKGIVNSSQLEMELVRMFANAMMFNPLPRSERGFGRSLRLRKNGGDVDIDIEPEGMSTSEESESGNQSGTDEDGIISDAREMFNDVVEVVSKWRQLEGERMGLSGDAIASISRHGSLVLPVSQTAENGRHASVSASSNVGDDDTAAGESEAASTPVPTATSGPGRKRRRIAEY